MQIFGCAYLAIAVGGCVVDGGAAEDPVAEPGPSAGLTTALNPNIASDQQYNDPTGTFATYSATGSVALTGPFFVSLGTNGRTCFSCHQFDQGWTITPAGVQARFASTSGTDPIFATLDGANSPHADVSTLGARTAAYSMLLNKAVIRTGLPIPAGAEFTLSAVDDPYGFASATELSLFRRPPPTTNLRFLSTVMWDGRENLAGGTMDSDLLDQANTATLTHAAATTPLTAAQRRAIVDFETSIYTAQFKDVDAKDVNASGSTGGPDAISTLPFYIGMNDPLGDPQTHAAFTPNVFNLYDIWATSLTGTGDKETARRAILRGELVFNHKQLNITGVSGINDEAAFGAPAVLVGTCTTCHDTPNIGNHSVAAALNIGIADGARRTPDMPLYTLRNKTTGATVQTTDPGRAMVTGKWKDIGRFKGPILRGAAARAPYFHNGAAATLGDVIAFYDARFNIGLTAGERADLLMFLRSL